MTPRGHAGGQGPAHQARLGSGLRGAAARRAIQNTSRMSSRSTCCSAATSRARRSRSMPTPTTAWSSGPWSRRPPSKSRKAPMARAQSRFVCQACGADFLRWEGQCRSCAAWNTLVETVVRRGPRARAARAGASRPGRTAEPVAALGARRSSDAAPVDRHARARSRAGRRDRARLAPPHRRGAGRRQVHAAAPGRRRAWPPARSGSASCMRRARNPHAQVRLRAARLGLGGGPAADAIEVLATSEVGAIVEVARAGGRRSSSSTRSRP